MKIFGNRVLIEQIMTKKDSLIITTASEDDKDQFNVTSKVIALGSQLKEKIKVGDIPILHKFAQADTIVNVDKSEDGKVVTLQLIMDCERITGVV